MHWQVPHVGRKFGMGTRVVFFVVVGTTILLGLFGYLGTAALQDNIKRTLQERVLLAQTTASNIDLLIAGVEQTLLHVSAEGNWADAAHVETALEQAHNHLSFYAARVFLLDVNGAVRCTSLTETSSRSLKRNIRSMSDALPRLLRLQGVTFEWDETHGGRSDLGFIAEDAAEVFPELVRWEGGAQAAGLNYTHLTAVLVEALKEQQAQIDRLVAQNESQLRGKDEEIKSLKDRLARVEAMMERSSQDLGKKP